MKLKLSVVVLAYNEEKVIGRCMDALYQQADDIDEVILIDNNCVDATAAIARRCYPGVTIIVEREQGMFAARTRGLDEAAGDVVARIDADTIVRPGWAKAIRRSYETPDVVGVTGSLGIAELATDRYAITWPFSAWRYVQRWQFPRHAPILTGCNMSLRKSTWQQIRDQATPGIDGYQEDFCISLLAERHGKIVYNRDMECVVHYKRSMNPRKILRYLRADYRTVAYYEKLLQPPARETR